MITSSPRIRAGTSSSTPVTPPRAFSAATCRLVWPTCDPTTTSPCPPAGAAGGAAGRRGRGRRPDLRTAQRRLRAHAEQGPHERGTGTEQERTAVPLGSQHSAGHGVEIGIFGGVDHHPPAVPDLSQQFLHPGRAAEPDVGQADAGHVAGPDRAAALLRDEVPQVRGAVAERGVPGELGLAHRDQVRAEAGPVNVTRRHPPGFQEGGDQQYPVEAPAGNRMAYRLQRRDLGHDVAAQGGVAPADQLNPDSGPFGYRDQSPCGPLVHLHRGRFVEAAGVGQHEAGAGRAVQRGPVGLLVQHGHDLHVVHRLRSGRVVVQDAQPQPVRGAHRADRLPEGTVVRKGVR